MKFGPLIWAALWRKPARLILTFLSVTVAFALFGITVGFNASVQDLIARSRLDRVFVGSRFGGSIPLAYEDRIARLRSVKSVAHFAGLPLYYRDARNRVPNPLMLSPHAGAVFTEMSLTDADWDRLNKIRNGIFISKAVADRYHWKAGDQLPLLTAAITRQDGGRLWSFTVLGVVDNIPQAFMGYTVGNYEYLDQARPLASRGQVGGIQLIVNDAGQAENTAHAIDSMFANSGAPTRSVTDRETSETAAQAGINIPFVTTMAAMASLFMILFLTGNVIAQSVRERLPEFALLKTFGFSDARTMMLVFVEAAIPCLLGAALGIAFSKALAAQVPRLFPPNVALPAPYMSPMVLSVAFVVAVMMAFLSAVVPAFRIRRLDIAATLMGH